MENTPVKKNKKGLIITIVSVVLLILVAVVAYFIVTDINERNRLEQEELARQAQVVDSIINSGVYHEGITINGVDVGGMTKEQAKEAVDSYISKTNNGLSIPLTLNDQSYSISGDKLGITYNEDEILEEAYNVAREGDYETLTAKIDDLKLNGQNFDMSFTCAQESVQAAVAELAKEADTEAKNATFQVDTEKVATVSNIEDALTYIDEVNGIAVDQTALAAAIVEHVNKGDFSAIEIPAQETPAEITVQDLKGNFTKRASASTSYAKSPYNRASRVKNLEKATGLLNATVLAPGEVFSTNECLGDRTYANGWEPAPAIVGGTTEDQAGGGVCQVSTTLYNAVVKADLEIVYRRGHSGTVGYIPRGLDATINTGTIDFQFKNNTSSEILLISYLKDKNVCIDVYGEAFATDEYDEIKLTSKQIKTISPPGKMKETVDKSKKPGYREVVIKRKSGSMWQSYKHYYKDGQLVKTEELDTTTYRAYAGEVIVGPEKAKETKEPDKTKKPEETGKTEETKKPDKTKAPEKTKTPEVATTT